MGSRPGDALGLTRSSTRTLNATVPHCDSDRYLGECVETADEALRQCDGAAWSVGERGLRKRGQLSSVV